MQQSLTQRIVIGALFFLLVASCTLLDVAVVHDSRIMMKWFGCYGGVILLAVSLPLWSKTREVHIRITDLAVALFIAFIFIADYSRGDWDSTLLLRTMVLLLLYLIFRQSLDGKALCTCMVMFLVVVAALAVWGVVQFVLAFIHHQPLHTAVVGNFDNPAGFALTLSLALPAAVSLLVSPGLSGLQKHCIYIASGIILLALILSASRTGWLSALCTGIYTYYLCCKKSRRWTGLFLIATILLFVLFYFIKQDSADGRSYIALCTWQQIADAPLWGHGRYGFTSGYMVCQADYLTTHPDSRFAWLADNVRHPFNEWLYLTVRYGIAGLIVLTSVLLSVIPAIKRELSAKHFLSIGLLVALFPFTWLSYPMQYPLAWVMLALAVGTLARNTKSVCRIHYRWVAPLLALLAACTVTPRLYCTLRTEMEWYDVATRSLSGQTRYVMPRYEELYRDMKHSPHFLYNYAAELNYIGEYQRSQQVLDECMQRMDDYDTRLLAASNHEQMGNYGLAEEHYCQASAMCPVRFVSLYRLAKLYGTMGRYDEQRDMARRIMDKAVKVPSRRITEIQNEMRYILEETDFQ